MKIRDAHFMEALYVVFVAICLFALSSCSHHKALEKSVDQEAQAQPAIPPGPELSQASGEVIRTAPDLKPEQKQKLEALRVQSSHEMDRLRAEIGQNQLVLVKNLVNPKVGQDKIKIVQSRIMDLEKERSKLWLDTLDEANHILGRRSESDERLYRAFILTEPDPNAVHRTEAQ